MPAKRPKKRPRKRAAKAAITPKDPLVTKGEELGLNAAQMVFCRLRAQGHSQVGAYREAYPKCNHDTARSVATHLAAKSSVSLFIRHLQREADIDATLSIVEKRIGLAAIFRTTHEDLIKEDGSIGLPEGPAAMAIKKFAAREIFGKKGELIATETTVEFYDKIATAKADNELQGVDVREHKDDEKIVDIEEERLGIEETMKRSPQLHALVLNLYERQSKWGSSTSEPPTSQRGGAGHPGPAGMV